MSLLVRRREWAQNPDYAGKKPWQESEAKGICIHHTAGVAPSNHDDCLAAVQAVEKQYQAKPEYRFAPYNFVVCRHGYRYVLRGFVDQGGANGTSESNRSYLSICLLGNAPTITPERAEAIKTIRRRWLKRFPNALEVHPHSRFVPTACPGTDARSFINDRGYQVDCALVNETIDRLRARITRLEDAKARGRCE